MKASDVSGAGVVPGPVWPPDVKVPSPGPVGVTSTQVAPASPGVGIEYGVISDDRSWL